MVRLRTRKPIVLLIRRILDDKPVWLEHSGHASNADAELAWERQIRGRGVTAWSCWVHRYKAAKMLNDPSIMPDGE